MSTSNPETKKVTDSAEDQPLDARIDRLEGIVDDLCERVEELEDEVDDQGKRMNALSKGVTHAKDEIEILNAHTGLGDVDDPEEAESRESQQDERDETALEDVVSLPEPIAQDSLSSNQLRARFVAKDIVEYSTSVPAGRKIQAGEIRRVLRAGTECNGHTETVDRVIKILDRLGEDEVTVRFDRDGERQVVFDDELAAGLRSAKTRSRRCDSNAGEGA